MLEACDGALRDAEEPERYRLEPGPTEVIYRSRLGSRTGPRRRAPLRDLLRGIESRWEVRGVRIRAESPAVLLLEAVRELRQTALLAVEVAALVEAARAIEADRAALLAAVARVSPEAADAIALELEAALAGPPLLPRPPRPG